MNPLCENVRDFRGGHNRGQRAAIANAFGHGDDVRNDVLVSKAPIVRAGAAEAGLHFVGDAKAAGRTRRVVGGFEIAVRERQRSRPRPGSIRQ